MDAEKCRRPNLYTRSKSACRKSRALRGNEPWPDRDSTSRFDFPGTLAVTVTLNFQIAVSSSLRNYRNVLRAMTGVGAGFVRATGLFAETWFHRDPLAPLGATAGKYFLAALGLHARAKAVYLRSLAPVGLECTLGQSSSLLIPSTVLGQTVSINHSPHYHQPPLPTHNKCLSFRGSRERTRRRLEKPAFPAANIISRNANFFTPPLCTFHAAVTIALLDSTTRSGNE